MSRLHSLATRTRSGGAPRSPWRVRRHCEVGLHYSQRGGVPLPALWLSAGSAVVFATVSEFETLYAATAEAACASGTLMNGCANELSEQIEELEKAINGTCIAGSRLVVNSNKLAALAAQEARR